MRIIHTSDWHLGQFFYNKSRAKEHQQFLQWLLAQVKIHAVDVIIVAGDVFDTATPPSYARQMYFNFISDLQVFDCQLIILAGNHDAASMLSESKALLDALSTKVIANVSDVSISANLAEQVFILKNKQGHAKAAICAIPFIRPRDVIKSQAGQSATDKSQQLQQAIVDHYQALYTQAKSLVAEHAISHVGEKLPIIATGHLTALGVTLSDSVREIYIGTLEALPSNVFPPADYIALGHIHRAQKVGKNTHIRYCGSPIALSFDEAQQQKRALLVEFNENILSTVTDLNIPCFQPLAMLKTNLATLHEDIETLIDSFPHKQSVTENVLVDNEDEDQKIWLDIELTDSGTLTNLQSHISNLVKDYPVEVLLVRRAKQVRLGLLQAQHQDRHTLSELTFDEVFESRLQQEPWLDNQQSDHKLEAEQLKRKSQLQTLFKQTVEQVLSQDDL